MKELTIKISKRNCAFVLHISEPGDTLKKLAMFFQDRHIIIDNLNMHRYRNGEAMPIIHCQLEKDRIERTVKLLEEMPGIIELERMEEK